MYEILFLTVGTFGVLLILEILGIIPIDYVRGD